MAFDSWPNQAHASRAISLAEHEQLAYALGGSGLLDYDGTTPVYADGSGRQVKLRAGVKALIRGTRFLNTTETILDNTKIIANTSGSPRIDLVVLRLDRTAAAPNAYTISPVVITGLPAATPIAPSPVRSDPAAPTSYYDIPLAEVTVANGATTLAAGTVKNRAWWVSSSGYTGFDAAKPPVEPGVFFKANDGNGLTYVGTAGGSWQVVQQNTGWIALNPPSGWSATAFEFCRANDQVTMNARLIRTGAAVVAPVTLANLGDNFKPSSKDINGLYYCTDPGHTSIVYVKTTGEISFVAGNSALAINQNAQIVANVTWPIAA